MCFLWITLDNQPGHEYTNEFRGHKEKLDTTRQGTKGVANMNTKK